MRFSELTRRLDAPAGDVWAVHNEASERAAAGEDVIVLSVGDPDFPTPDYIIERVQHSLRNHRTHYSPAAGEPELLQAIADLESTLGPEAFGPEQFVVFPGATAALHATFACLLDAGDEVIVPDPMYIGYQGIIAAVGAKAIPVPLTQPGFGLDVEATIAALTQHTRAVIVNTPGNPCGNVVPAGDLKRLIDACRALDIWVVVDEVYSLFTFDAPHVSGLRLSADLANVVVIDGLSKSHAMSGWRIGWAASNPEMVAALTRLSGAVFFGCAQFVQDGAAEAIKRDADEVRQMRAGYRERRDYACRRLDAHNALSYVRPDAGMFVMINVAGTGMNGDQFARRLLDAADVSVIPGGGFGASTVDYVRLSLTVDQPALSRAFDRIDAFLRNP